jgi:hypothetical protein
MGCSEIKSKREQFIYELWESTTICQCSSSDYIDDIKSRIEDLKTNIKNDSKSIADSLLEQTVEKYIVNTAQYHLFENIRIHFYKDNVKHKLGYNIFFVLVFLIDSSKRQKIWMFNELFTILKDIYNLKGNIKTNPILFTNIITMYIDLVSFCTMGYYLKLNLNCLDETEFIKMNKIFECFNIKNRGLLIKELFSSSIFNLDEFLEFNEEKIDHNQIRKIMVEYKYGKGAFLKMENDN